MERKEYFTAQEAWNKIVAELSEAPRDLKTVPKKNKDPIWFNASVSGNYILINKACVKQPSSRLSMPRPISFKEFEKVYGYYFKWKNDEPNARSKASSLSQNTSYIFGLIEYFGLSTLHLNHDPAQITFDW